MKKLFISADIEGTCGIAHWDETEKGQADYSYFADQMSREVAAACEGALDSGFNQIVVKDAHDSARNINPRNLPQGVEIIRGWAGDPFCMMVGLDKSFDGVVFTGYHSAAGRDSNPLSHTMTTSAYSVKINNEPASELLINSLIASYVGVPVYAVSGDKGLCDWMKGKSPNTAVIPLNEGMGAAVKSIHPDLALQSIQDTVRDAVKQPGETCMFPMPEFFDVEICYRDHAKAKRNSFYPGVELTSERCIRFLHDDFYEVLRMMHFCL
jgi:D-amino peptidase